MGGHDMAPIPPNVRAAPAESRGGPRCPSRRLTDSVWTIGHSTRSLEALLALLHAHGIRRVTDVRRFPRSRRHPQFNTDAPARALPAAGLAYGHQPALGGFRRPRRDSRNTGWRNASFRGYADYMETGEFAAGLDALLEEARTAPTA